MARNNRVHVSSGGGWRARAATRGLAAVALAATGVALVAQAPQMQLASGNTPPLPPCPGSSSCPAPTPPTSCTGANCHSGGSGSTSNPGPSNGHPGPPVTLPPMVAPVEPICTDQGGAALHPIWSGQVVIVNGVKYDKEYIDCSSTIAGAAEMRREHGSELVVTQTPPTPPGQPPSNPSCAALTWWVDPTTAFDNHKYHTGIDWQYWGVRAGYGYAFFGQGSNAYFGNQIASFCQIWFLAAVPGAGNTNVAGHWYFGLTTNLSPNFPAPTFQSYNVPPLYQSSQPGGSNLFYPPSSRWPDQTSNGFEIPASSSPYGRVYILNDPYVYDATVPPAPSGTISASAPIELSTKWGTFQVGTASLAMSYTTQLQGEQITSPTVNSPNTGLSGPVVTHAPVCTPSQMQYTNSVFGNGGNDYMNNQLMPGYVQLAPSSSLCEIQFGQPSVTPFDPHATWSISVHGIWALTYHSATYQTHFDTSLFHIPNVAGAVVPLPASSSGTVTPGSALWPNPPDGTYDGPSTTVQVRLQAIEGVPVPNP